MFMDGTAQTQTNASSQDNFSKLRLKVQQSDLPTDLSEKLLSQLFRLEKAVYSSGYKIEFDRELQYLEFVATLPFNKSSQDILDLKRATEILNKNHYGIAAVKDKILEYLSVLILNSRQGRKIKAPILCFLGLVGSGKTSLAYSVAESLGREIIRIPFGGMGSVTELRGGSRVNPEAEAGRLIKAIQTLGVNNPVVLLDEIDRVATETRWDVMGVLVELLDPAQNNAFLDHYVDFPFDLSNVLFISTANNTGNIATAVLDRLEVIEMPSYTDEEKIVIGKNYVLSKTIKETGLPEGSLEIDESLWPQIVRPLGFDAGIRSLQRTIEGIVRKVAKNIVEGRPGPYHLTTDNIGQYLN